MKKASARAAKATINSDGKTPPSTARRVKKPVVIQRHRYDWLGAEAKAKEGRVPTAPDFSAPTHKFFRSKLDAVVAAAKARDVKALKAIEVNPTSSSPKTVARYRDICLMALTKK